MGQKKLDFNQMLIIGFIVLVSVGGGFFFVNSKIISRNTNGSGTQTTTTVEGGIHSPTTTTINLFPIKKDDPAFQNSSQPNLATNNSGNASTVELNNFQKSRKFTKDMILPDYQNYVRFFDNTGDSTSDITSNKILISGIPRPTVFALQGNTIPRTVAFSLSREQKGIFLQFGLKDLSEQGDNVIYDVSVSISTKAGVVKDIWSGKIIYNSSANQIVSLPFDANDAESLSIKYSVSQGSTDRQLYFTRAELLYN